MHREILDQRLGRRGILTGALLAGAALALEACTGPQEERPYTDLGGPGIQQNITPGPEPTPKPGITSVYLPTWYTPAQYASVTKNLGPTVSSINRVHLAYATPNPSGAIDLNLPKVPKGATELLKAGLFKDTGLSVAVGGPDTTVAGWSAAFADTARFGRNARDLIDRLEQLFRRTVHLDLNISVHPQVPDEITNLVRASRTAIDGMSSSGVHELSLAVQPFPVDRLDMGDDGVNDHVHTFRLMTYDENGPWSNKSGPIADIDWTSKALLNWSSSVAGEDHKLQVGFPSYGCLFPGAKHEGDDFKRPRDTRGLFIPYNQIPRGSIDDNSALLTTSGKIGNDYVSCLSPNVIGQQTAEIRNKYPRLGGWFFWAADGLTADHIKATSNA